MISQQDEATFYLDLDLPWASYLRNGRRKSRYAREYLYTTAEKEERVLQ